METAQKYDAPDASVPSLNIDPFSDDFLTDPYSYHQQIRDAGDLVWLESYGIWASARYETVRAGLNDWQNFISSAGVGLANFRTEKPFRPPSLILEADPPQHTRSRTVLARILSPRAMKDVRDKFEKEAEALIERLVAQGDIDAVKDLAEAFPLKVFPDAVGLTSEGRENLLLYGNMIFNAFGPRNHLFEKAAQNYEPVRAWVMKQCEREELRPGGFGDQIYQAVDTGEISHEEAPMLVRSFLSAGVDSTISGIGNLLFTLANHPDQYAKLITRPDLARSAFEEGLRYDSAVQTFFRTVNSSMEWYGLPLTENDKVVFFLGAANRDPRQWQNPDVFDIERKTVGHMGFGTGIHGCVGQAVGRLEGELILTALAKRVKRIELTGAPVRRLNNTMRAFESLPMRLIPH